MLLRLLNLMDMDPSLTPNQLHPAVLATKDLPEHPVNPEMMEKMVPMVMLVLTENTVKMVVSNQLVKPTNLV